MIKDDGYVFYSEKENNMFREVMRDLHFFKGDPYNPGHKLCEPSGYFNGGTYWAIRGTETELAEVEAWFNRTIGNTTK